MKRYISAILIPCMLLHLFGCGYNTFSEITVEELKNYDGSIIKIKTNEDEFTIEEESYKYKTYWEAGDSSIIIIKKEIFDFVEIPADTTHISYNEIEKIEIEKRENYTALETVGRVTGAVLGATALIILLTIVVSDALLWD
jgi:hypothetical protein